MKCKTYCIVECFIFHFIPLCYCQGHETSALLILEKISDRNLINCTNATLRTYVFLSGCRQTLSCTKDWLILTESVPPPLCRPLHVAARKGLTVVVQELLRKGASVLAVDENGQH